MFTREVIEKCTLNKLLEIASGEIMTHIYFAHAIADYNTDYERECLKLINETFEHCTIHNPKDLNKIINKNMPEPGRFKAYFFPEILKCDVLIAAPVFNKRKVIKNEEFMSGTKKEIEYALEHKKQIFKIKDNKLIDITQEMKDFIKTEERYKDLENLRYGNSWR